MKRKCTEQATECDDNPRKKIKLNKNIEQKSESRSSFFVQCPICKSSVYSSLINIHIDTECIHKKVIKKKKTSKKTNTNTSNTSNTSNKRSEHKWIQCPLCNKTLLSSQINFHIDLECSSLKSKKKKSKNNNNTNNNNNNSMHKLTKCPKCGKHVLLTQINFHLDLNCNNNKPIKPIKRKKYDINDYKTDVRGLYLFKEFITKQESTELIEEINRNKWVKNRDNGLRGIRRSQHYGPPMDEMYRVVSSSKYFTKIPSFSASIGERISKFWNSCSNIPIGSIHNKLSILNANDFNELLINEYQSHNELLFHFDQRGAFEELLCGLSLVSGSKMAFQHKDNQYDIIKAYLPPRSVYFMTGDSRYKYKHGFIKNDIDGYRISLTYRTVKSIFYAAKPPKMKRDNVYTTSTSKQLRLDKTFFTKSNE